MKLAGCFGRWATTKAAVAVAGAVAICGAIGSAVAFSPIITAPIKWGGGVEFIPDVVTGLNKVYTVPAGRNFLLTDIVATNFAGTASNFNVYAGPGGVCDPVTLVPRLSPTLVPPANNTVLAFQTGIGFGAGLAVCIVASAPLEFTGRGFLFTPI